MSCMVMNPEPLAALANAVEARLNYNYEFWGFDAPSSLHRELQDCQTSGLYDAEPIYRRLYALNVRAFNERYKWREEPLDDMAPTIDGSKFVIHKRPEYREHGFAVQTWHYHLAQLLDFWIYQTSEDAVRDDPLRQAIREFRDFLYAFIIRNSPQYTSAQWGELPPSDEPEIQGAISMLPGKPCGVCTSAYTDPELDSDHDLSYTSIGEWAPGYRALLRSGDSRPTELVFETWGTQWNGIGFYRPRFCPNCGRELTENIRYEQKRKGEHHDE